MSCDMVYDCVGKLLASGFELTGGGALEFILVTLYKMDIGLIEHTEMRPIPSWVVILAAAPELRVLEPIPLSLAVAVCILHDGVVHLVEPAISMVHAEPGFDFQFPHKTVEVEANSRSGLCG